MSKLDTAVFFYLAKVDRFVELPGNTAALHAEICLLNFLHGEFIDPGGARAVPQVSPQKGVWALANGCRSCVNQAKVCPVRAAGQPVFWEKNISLIPKIDAEATTRKVWHHILELDRATDAVFSQRFKLAAKNLVDTLLTAGLTAGVGNDFHGVRSTDKIDIIKDAAAAAAIAGTAAAPTGELAALLYAPATLVVLEGLQDIKAAVDQYFFSAG